MEITWQEVESLIDEQEAQGMTFISFEARPDFVSLSFESESGFKEEVVVYPTGLKLVVDSVGNCAELN